MAKLLSGTRIYGTATIDTQLFVSGTTISVSTTTGALQVTGGVGVGGNIYAAGITATNISVGIWPVSTSSFNTSTLVASAVTATNAIELVGGAVGSIAYQSAPNITDFISIGPNGYVLTSNGTTATWQASSGGTASLGNIITTAQGWNLP